MEDLRRLAPQAFRLALAGCAHACRDYHATWPYRRLAGTVGSLEVDRAMLVDLLRARDAREAVTAVAIAGAADAGLLAMVLEALGHRGDALTVTVVDRCATPLALCRSLAGATAVRVETLDGDLREVRPARPQDVVLLHSVLLYVPAADHVAALAGLRRWLRPGGLLLLSSRLGEEGPQPSQAASDARATVAVAALEAAGIALPEPAPAFRIRLAARTLAGLPSLAASQSTAEPGAYAALAVQAGFAVRATVTVPPRADDPRRPVPDRPRVIVVAEVPA